jgi:hypothetical protein
VLYWLQVVLKMIYVVLSPVSAQNVIVGKNIKIQLDGEKRELIKLVGILEDLNPLPKIPVQTEVQWTSQLGNDCVFVIVDCSDPTFKGKSFSVELTVWKKNFRPQKSVKP